MIANKVINKDMLTANQYKLYDQNSDILEFFRRNPVIACEELLGIKLYDFQAYMLQQTWNSENSLWLLTRNGSKTVLSAIYIKLRTLLFEEQEFWVVSKTGRQARKLFSYIEKLSLNQISEFASLKDIYAGEIYKANKSLSGFSHDPSGYTYSLLNNSRVTTLNGVPENNRGERGSVLLDEIGFMSEEQIVACEAFATTDKTLRTSTDKSFNMDTLGKAPPLQLIYASSASDKMSYYYQKYKEFSKNMIAGDTRYFAIDINADIPLSATIDGKEAVPILNKAKVDSAMSTNLPKALREYYNRFDSEYSNEQIIKSHIIERNTTFQIPEIHGDGKSKYIFGYDTASVADNSVLGVMKICFDENRGYYGKLVNMINFKKLSDKTSNKQMLYPDQIEKVRESILAYNGNNAEYEKIHKIAVDAGMGGGGLLYSHTLMFNWKDSNGFDHRGVIDKEYFKDEVRAYPNAYAIMRMVEPTKWKPIMAQRLIDLMELGLIEFPEEYSGNGYLDIEQPDGELVRMKLSQEEELALMNIDLCKEETKMIHRTEKDSGRVTYKTRDDMAGKIRDDRFYVLLLLANELYELRDMHSISKHKTQKTKDKRYLKLIG